MPQLQRVSWHIKWEMNDISDYELIMLIREKNEDAELLLEERYFKLIKYLLYKNRFALKKLGLSYDDLYNDCWEAYRIALDKYFIISKASFHTFAELIISRRIKKIMLTKLRELVKWGNNVSVEDIVDNSWLSLQLSKKELDPLHKLLADEKDYELNKMLLMNLDRRELIILSLLYQDFNYVEISNLLNIKYNKVYNAIVRIRRKIKKSWQSGC